MVTSILIQRKVPSWVSTAFAVVPELASGCIATLVIVVGGLVRVKIFIDLENLRHETQPLNVGHARGGQYKSAKGNKRREKESVRLF